MPKAPTLDGKVLETDGSGWLVKRHSEPAEMPGNPTVKIKNVPADGKFSRANGEFTWDPPISIYATVQVFDGETLAWEWSAIRGDLMGE